MESYNDSIDLILSIVDPALDSFPAITTHSPAHFTEYERTALPLILDEILGLLGKSDNKGAAGVTSIKHRNRFPLRNQTMLQIACP